MAYCVPKGIPHSEFLKWDTNDQDAALGWEREQRLLCKGCGTRQSEWDKDRFAYLGAQKHCMGCEVLAQEQENVHEQARGVTVHLVPAAFAEPPEEEGP